MRIIEGETFRRVHIVIHEDTEFRNCTFDNAELSSYDAQPSIETSSCKGFPDIKVILPKGYRGSSWLTDYEISKPKGLPQKRV